MNFYPIEIKFHNGSGKWGLNAETAIKTISSKIHVEGRFPSDGKSFSSTAKKEADYGKNGVRYKDIQYSHPERWTTYILWVTEEELTNIRFGCDCLVALGLGYDFRGAAGCAITGKENPWLWFCSEVIYDRFCTQWLPTRLNHKMHPDKLEEIIIKLEAKLLERKYAIDGA